MSEKESIQHVVDSMKESRQQTACSKQGENSLPTTYSLLPTKKNSLSTAYSLLPTKSGFTLVELMITIVIFVLVIAAASSVFTSLLTQFKQQSKITETDIEGAVGLEMLRRDLESAGYGLPWVFQTAVTYYESEDAIGKNYNETPINSPTNPPRAIVAGDNVGLNGSDYLVIKSITVARNWAAGKWTYLMSGNTTTVWTPNTENVNVDNNGAANNNVRVIVISPGSTTTDNLSLVVDTSSNTFTDKFTNAVTKFASTDPNIPNIMYGVAPFAPSDAAYSLRMPFNRADYYISTSNVPKRCASNTGVLMKGIVNNTTDLESGGKITTFLPILDCVADMQVIYRLDMDSDSNGIVGTSTSPASSAGTVNCVSSSEGANQTTVKTTLDDASLLRTRLREVRVYILAQEGQIDRNYSYPNQTITVGDDSGCGSSFDLSAIGLDWRNYRWKVYTLIIRPNLR